MIIEWHTHAYPPEEIAADVPAFDGKSGAGWGNKPPMTLENVMEAHDRAGIDITVISNAAHYLRGKPAAEELPAVRRWSDYIAKVQADSKGRFYGFATILPCGGPEHVREAERAVRELGLKGFLIHSNHKGSYPDDDEARPFWELAQELGVPVFIHPPAVGFGEERMREYRLASSVGRPFDLCLALSRLIVRGVLEDFPNLKLVASHGGGGLCEVIGRLNYAYEMGDEVYFLGPYEPMRIKHKPGYYLEKIYLDTVTYHRPAAELVLATVGADRLLYGSDAPPLTTLKPRAIELVQSLDVSEEDREKIFWRNAAKLLRLTEAELHPG